MMLLRKVVASILICLGVLIIFLPFCLETIECWYTSRWIFVSGDILGYIIGMMLIITGYYLLKNTKGVNRKCQKVQEEIIEQTLMK